MWVRVFDYHLSLLGPKGKLRELGDRVWVGSGACLVLSNEEIYHLCRLGPY